MRAVLMIAGIALLIAGFLARRLMMPRAVHYLTHARNDSGPADTLPSSNDQSASNQDDTPPAAAADGPREHLTDSDRRALDEVIRRKTGGH